MSPNCRNAILGMKLAEVRRSPTSATPSARTTTTIEMTTLLSPIVQACVPSAAHAPVPALAAVGGYIQRLRTWKAWP